MKSILIAMLTTLSFSVLAQDTLTTTDSLDTMLMQSINTYRVHNNLTAVKWNDKLHAMAKHHSTYQALAKYVGHKELQDIEGFKEINTLRERYEYYVNKPKPSKCSENARGGDSKVVLTDTSEFGKFVLDVYKVKLTAQNPQTVMIYYSVFRWSKSPGHNANMLSTFCRYGSTSIVYRNLHRVDKSLFHNGLPVIHFTAYATMNYGD